MSRDSTVIKEIVYGLNNQG